MDALRWIRNLIVAASVAGLLLGCGAPPASPVAPTPVASASPAPASATATSPPAAAPADTPLPPTATPAPVATVPPAPTPTEAVRADGLSAAEAATLGSLEQVDGHPLYTMRYYGPYEQRRAAVGAAREPLVARPASAPPAWACSLFAAMGDPDSMLYGRNFDWEPSPAVLLFTQPPGGYASVSMVDIAYLGFTGAAAGDLLELPLVERQALLDAPFLPFDGMNERGLVVGMAAVPPGDVPPDPTKKTVGSLGVIREMLDRASNVEQAVEILRSYNIDFSDGPALHYLVADPSGRALLVEFYGGEMFVIPNEAPYHLATNFLRTAAGESAAGECWRYDMLDNRLAQAAGRMAPRDALGLLDAVSQDNTQWSIVYGISTAEIRVAMGHKYDAVHTFQLDAAGD